VWEVGVAFAAPPEPLHGDDDDPDHRKDRGEHPKQNEEPI